MEYFRRNVYAVPYGLLRQFYVRLLGPPETAPQIGDPLCGLPQLCRDRLHSLTFLVFDDLLYEA